VETVTKTSKEQEYLQVFQKVTRLISMVLDPQQVMDTVVHRLPTLLDVDAATIRLLDSSTNTFVLGAAQGVSDEYLSRAAIDSEEAMAMIMSGHPVTTTELTSEEMAREGIVSILSLPITFQGHIMGIMRLLTRKARIFSTTDISFSMALAEQIGVAISNARLFSEMENQVDFLQEVRTISRLVNSTLDLNTILQTIVEKLPQIMRVKACTIRLLQPETNKLELVAASGLSAAYLQRGSIRKEDSIFVALKGEPVAIFDAPSDKRVLYHEALRQEGIKSILAVPIKKGNEVIGVLRLLTNEHHCFTASEVSFAVTAAEEGGNAIQNSRTYQKITLLFNQIEENERFLQDILDSLSIQLMVLNTKKHVVMVNRLFLEENNLREDEVLGQPFQLIAPWSLEGQPCLCDTILASKEKATAIVEVENKGQKQWFEQTATPILAEDGAVEFVIEAVRDITSSQLLAQEKMERMKLEGVLEMAGTAAHELNTPLFAALGAAQLMQEDLEDEEMLEDMAMIIRNMKIMGELTRKMTSMTGFDSKQYVGDTKIINFAPGEQGG
jgi:two-component system NtrC family sensor kinase